MVLGYHAASWASPDHWLPFRVPLERWYLVVGGVMQGVTALSVNGTGTGTYQGASGDVTVSNVVIPKTTGAYPTSGTVTVISGGITITVTFNGTRYAQGTYVYRNKTVTFTIDLETGEVTKP